MSKPHSFPKQVRLSEKAAIQKIFSEGQFRRFGPLNFKYVQQDAPSFRMVISISKRVGHSPQRNRLKRLIREVVRQREDLQASAMDLAIFIKNPPAQPLTFAEVQTCLERFFGSLKV